MKTCLDCQHLSYSTAQPEYGEYTPGYEASMSCNKNHWCYDGYNDDLRMFRAKLYMARDCQDFVKSTT